MSDPVCNRGIGQKTKIGGPCGRLRGFGVEFTPFLMQVDFGLPEPERPAFAAIGHLKLLAAHP